MTDYYSFYLSFVKYSEDQASQPNTTEVAKLITDREVKNAYKQYLITVFSGQALCGMSSGAVFPPAVTCANAKKAAIDLVNSLGW